MNTDNGARRNDDRNVQRDSFPHFNGNTDRKRDADPYGDLDFNSDIHRDGYTADCDVDGITHVYVYPERDIDADLHGDGCIERDEYVFFY